MKNPIPPVKRNVGVYVHNGSEWRKLKGNSLGHAFMTVLPVATRIEIYKNWGQTIGAGQSFTLLDTTSGRGRVLHCFLRIDGKASEAEDSELCFFVDGEASASTKIAVSDIFYYWAGARLVDICPGGVIVWDTTYFDYQIWIHFGPAFESSLKITFTNKDPANSISLRYAIWVEWCK